MVKEVAGEGGDGTGKRGDEENDEKDDAGNTQG